MKNEQDMAAFEAAMRYQGFFTPQRFPPQASAGISAQDEYLSARDQDRYAGWKMAMEATGDERELCARMCEDLPAPESCNAIERSLWDVATMACAAAIRERATLWKAGEYHRIGTLYSESWPITECGWRFALGDLKCTGYAVERDVFVIGEK